MSIEVVRGAGAPQNPLPFSPAVRAGEFVFVSGQASVDHRGEIVSDSFEGEFRRAMKNVSGVLAAAGLSLSDVVQVRGYVDRVSDVSTYNRLYREFFTEPYPARTTLVGCLGGIVKFEIDVVAYKRR